MLRSRKPVQASASQPAATTSPVSGAEASNEAASGRAGLGSVPGSGSLLGGDVTEVLEWMWEGAMDKLGLKTDEVGDAFELGAQTAGNMQSAAKRLQEASVMARDVGNEEAAKMLGAAGARFGKVDGLATDLKLLVEVKKDLDLLKRLSATTQAMVGVDMRSPEAAATVDAWFAAVGEVGGELCKLGGMWGPILAPYAGFIQKLGECGFFSAVKYNMQAHGLQNPDDPNAIALWEAENL